MKNIYTISAAKSSSTPYSKEITPNKLVKILKGELSLEPWIPYLDIFFNELPKVLLLNTLTENGISKKEALNIYAKLPKALQNTKTERILDE